MNILQKLFVNLHIGHDSRKAWRARLCTNWHNDNNHVYIIRNGKRHECNSIVKGITIRIEGKNNCIEIDESCHFSEGELRITGNHNHVRFESEASPIYLSVWIADDNRLFTWGKRSRCGQLRCFVQDKDLRVGQDCMFSDQIEIMTSDAHAICDKATGNLLNQLPGQMVIGNHVWVGRRVFLTKRACIPNGCIVGACSVVTKPFTKENCILAGFPARVVKEGIVWHEDATWAYAAQHK